MFRRTHLHIFIKFSSRPGINKAHQTQGEKERGREGGMGRREESRLFKGGEFRIDLPFHSYSFSGWTLKAEQKWFLIVAGGSEKEGEREREKEKDNAGRAGPALDEMNAYEVECRVFLGGSGLFSFLFFFPYQPLIFAVSCEHVHSEHFPHGDIKAENVWHYWKNARKCN